MKKFLVCLVFFSVVVSSCKMKTDDVVQALPKKQNKLEKTQWKSTSTSQWDSDILLDFYTYQDVQEYLTLPNGQEIKARVGTYRLSKTGHVKINFGKLKKDKLNGHLNGKELIINETLTRRTYHKVKDY